jgi:drug/metabolite transporter (DMT)-like permease
MKPLIVWCVLSVIWGTTWLFIKIGLQDLPPLSFAGIRFVIAVLVLFLIIAIERAPLPQTKREIALIAGTGSLAFAVNYGLLFWGEQYISSGLAAVLQAIIPAFGLVIANFHLPNERITVLKSCSVALGIAGVAVIFSDQLLIAGTLALAGSAAVVIGAFCAAYSNVLIKAYGINLRPTVLAAGQMLCGLFPLLIIGAWTEGSPLKFRWTWLAVVSLLYLALVGSVAAFWLYYWLVKNMDVTKTMMISLVTPLVAVTLGWVALGERLEWRTLAGGALIMISVSLVLARRTVEQISPDEIARDLQP